MIQRMSHASIFVLDQDLARDFYVNKLGFEVNTDQTMPNGFRWLTVNPKGQPDLEIILMKVAPGPKLQEEDVATMTHLIKRGALRAAAFATATCRKTYADLKAQRIRSLSQPK